MVAASSGKRNRLIRKRDSRVVGGVRALERAPLLFTFTVLREPITAAGNFIQSA
jgi:hypothetical protein